MCFPIISKRSSVFGYQFRQITCMGLVADPTRASLALIGHMYVMKILIAVAEFCVDRGLGETQQVLFVARETEIVVPLLVRGVDIDRIILLQQTIKRAPVGIMTGLALTELYRTMQVFLACQFLFDIA